MESWRVGDTIAETLCEAAGDLCTAIVALRAETGANESADEDPVARLDRLRPDWRNSLPFAIEERDVRTLVEQMVRRSEEHTSELQSLMRISYAVFCLKKKKTNNNTLKPTSTT